MTRPDLDELERLAEEATEAAHRVTEAPRDRSYWIAVGRAREAADALRERLSVDEIRWLVQRARDAERYEEAQAARSA